MIYPREHPYVKSFLGSPKCPECGGSLVYEATVGLFYCAICDKEKMEEYFKLSKEKRNADVA